MAAMKGDGQRAFLSKPFQGSKMIILIKKNQRRHRLPNSRGALAHVMCLEPRHQVIHGVLKMWSKLRNRIGKGLQAFCQRGIHVPGLDECLLRGPQQAIWTSSKSSARQLLARGNQQLFTRYHTAPRLGIGCLRA